MITLNHASDEPLYEQIYRQVKEGIKSGEYPLHNKLPSIRELMSNLRCSRNTVEAAYRMLVQEGYARSQPGSGYVVEDYARFALRKKRSETADADKDKAKAQTEPELRYDFAYGPLQPGTFPSHTWRMLTNEVLLELDDSVVTSYAGNQGELCLREEVAKLVRKQRGIVCDPDQVFISNGAQPCIQSLLHMFDPNRDFVAMEEPGYDAVRTIVEAHRFRIKPCRVTDGRDEFVGHLYESGARLAYLTPSCQFPTGNCMSMQMRRNVLKWAEDTDAYILEDDYCYEFQYGRGLVESLFAMDQGNRVIYMGTFSKSLSPALRVNYLILPANLAAIMGERTKGHLGSVSVIEQHVIARYVRDGYWQRHLRKLQTLNTRKHDMLIESLKAVMGDRIELYPAQASLHLLIDVRDGRSQAELVRLAREKGVGVYETDPYWIAADHPMRSCILLGFSSIKPEDIEPGIKALAEAWFGDEA